MPPAELADVGPEAPVVEPQAAGGLRSGVAVGTVGDNAECRAAGNGTDADVCEHAPQRKHAFLLPVAGNEARVRVPGNGRVPRAPGVEDRVQQLFLPAALEPGQPDDLAAHDIDVVAEIGRQRPGEPHQHVLGGGDGHRVLVNRIGVSTHQLHEPADRGVRGMALPCGAAVAQHHHLGGDVDDLLQLVADEDEGEPGLRPVADESPQLL